MIIFRKSVKFEWDKGNQGKNFLEHQVTDEECEEVFFDSSKKILRDVLHSKEEGRYILLGKTKDQRLFHQLGQ